MAAVCSLLTLLEGRQEYIRVYKRASRTPQNINRPAQHRLLLFFASFSMRYLNLAGAFVAAITPIASAIPFLERILPRQNSINSIQNWSNDFADVDFNNNAGGNFNVTWDNGPGGNFVVGKGYRPARDM